MISPEVMVSDLHIFNQLSKSSPEDNGNGQPLQPCRSLDPVPLLPRLLLKLDVIEKDKDIDLVHKVEVSEPRQICWLTDCYFHFAAPFSARTKRSETF